MLEKIKKISIRALVAPITFLHFPFSLLLFSLLLFSFLPTAVQAQTGEIPSEIFGKYNGELHITNTTFGIDQAVDASVLLEETGDENDYVLKIADLEIMGMEIPIEMDRIIITPFAEGYNLSRSEPITFIIPEIYIPPIPPLLPQGGVFYDVPVKITLGNSQIVDFVLQLNIEIVATITIIIIPVPITFNMAFEGALFSPPIITTTELPSGTVGEAYNATLEANGATPITWSIINGALPVGLTLDALTGAISGIPTESDTLQFTVMATNASGNDTKLLSIEIDIEDIDTVGISTTKIVLLKVYPNPTTGELRISPAGGGQRGWNNYELRIKSVEVYDVYGRKLSSHHLITSSSNQLINISQLPEGIYLLKIQTEQGVQIRKIIKQ